MIHYHGRMNASERLYDRSVKAARRYTKDDPPRTTDIGHAIQTAKFEMFRVGWMIGYRAGHAAGRKGARW